MRVGVLDRIIKVADRQEIIGARHRRHGIVDAAENLQKGRARIDTTFDEFLELLVSVDSLPYSFHFSHNRWI